MPASMRSTRTPRRSTWAHWSARRRSEPPNCCAEHECSKRGPYGGAVGYLTHAGDMDTAIVIRSALVRNGVAHISALAPESSSIPIPSREAEETRRKAMAVVQAVGGAPHESAARRLHRQLRFLHLEPGGRVRTARRRDRGVAERCDRRARARRARGGAGPRLLVLSPGPGGPHEAGCCVELCRMAAGRVPLFGVCLGHQALVEAFGGVVESAGTILHGRAAPVEHRSDAVFTGIRIALHGRTLSLARDATPSPMRSKGSRAPGHWSWPCSIDGTRCSGSSFIPSRYLHRRAARLIENVCAWARESS